MQLFGSPSTELKQTRVPSMVLQRFTWQRMKGMSSVRGLALGGPPRTAGAAAAEPTRRTAASPAATKVARIDMTSKALRQALRAIARASGNSIDPLRRKYPPETDPDRGRRSTEGAIDAHCGDRAAHELCRPSVALGAAAGSTSCAVSWLRTKCKAIEIESKAMQDRLFAEQVRLGRLL